MKKILTAILIATFFLGAGVVNAQKEEKKERSEAKNVQPQKKRVLSKEERKKWDELFLKGKPSTDAVDKTTTSYIKATGITGDQTVEDRYAIVVGLGNYAGTKMDLCVDLAKTGENFPDADDGLAQYCRDQDAKRMKTALLKDEYGYLEDDIIILSDAAATRAEIINKINYIKDLEDANDEVTFFFSGHGVTGKYNPDETIENDEDLDEGIFVYDGAYDEQAFLNNPIYASTYDDEDTPLPASAIIWDDELLELFSGFDTERILFLFDTCRAGGMNDLKNEGSVLALASNEFQSASTYYLGGETTSGAEQDSEGLFTHYFVLRGMIDEYADGVNLLRKNSVNPPKLDGKVTIEEAFGYSYPFVKDYSSSTQTPVLIDNFTNDFLP